MMMISEILFYVIYTASQSSYIQNVAHLLFQMFPKPMSLFQWWLKFKLY